MILRKGKVECRHCEQSAALWFCILTPLAETMEFAGLDLTLNETRTDAVFVEDSKSLLRMEVSRMSSDGADCAPGSTSFLSTRRARVEPEALSVGRGGASADEDSHVGGVE
jgi:hypothetical protein